MNKTVCHISYHQALDDRIYWKELMALKKAGYNAVHICVSDTDAEYITSEGIQIIEIKRQKLLPFLWLNRIAQIAFKKHGVLKQILEKAKQVSADIYHYHDLQINALAKQLKDLPQQPKVVYDIHEMYWVVVKEQRRQGLLPAIKAQFISIFYKKWELKNAQYCDYLIATDEYTLNYFQKELPHIPKSIVYNYSFFLPEQNNNGLPKKYHFIYTGLLSRGRGIKEIVLATSVLAKEFPDAQVLFIGPFDAPDFEQEITKLIAQLHLSKHIQLHEPVAFTEIKEYYQQALIGLGIFHPTPKYTTFVPIKLFEYMAFGLPVIFSDHGPSANIIRKENCGLLVNPMNSEDIYAAMKKLLSDHILYNTFSRNAATAVQTQYNWEKEKEKLLYIYAGLLKS